MKRNDFILRLICIMCATVLLCGMLAACGPVVEDPQPTEAPTQAPTEDPTADPTEDPTNGPTEKPTEEPTTNGDSSIMDGEDHVEIPFG